VLSVSCTKSEDINTYFNIKAADLFSKSYYMEKIKREKKVGKIIWRKIKIFFTVLGITIFGFVFWEDIISQVLPDDIADGVWTSSSLVETGTGTSEATYINKWNNSTVIGNYFIGWYYDSVLWFFELDWSSDTSENVRIIGSTGACPSGYGYKLGGYAYSESVGFMDFDYSSSIFVYYCEIDKELHGYAYSELWGFQNFEGIWFEIIPNIGTISETTGTGVFVNDTTTIDEIVTFTGSTSNYDYNTIGGDTVNLDTTQESIFYIIK